MEDGLKIRMYSVTLDCREPRELAKFYAALLHWEIVPIPDEEYVVIAPPGAGLGSYPGITFQRNSAYVPPVWPEKPEKQQQMAHLDFAVNDVKSAVRYAVECGAAVAKEQFSDDWTVMTDPAGHPFCLCDGKHVFDSPDFALR
ncbi:MAG TPA: glyoxalase [Clostridiales bacterium]|nr:glyoxalase [Clostridiales bacterium]